MTDMHKLSLAFRALERNPNDGQAVLCAIAVLTDVSRDRVFLLTSRALWVELARILRGE